MRDFIDISDGVYDSLPSGEQNQETAYRLISDYNAIVDTAGSKSRFLHDCNAERLRAKEGLLISCKNLVTFFKDYEDARECLEIAKYNPPKADKEIEGYINAQLARLSLEKKKMEVKDKEKMEAREDEKVDVWEIWMSRVASVSQFFKMPIDINNISAAVFAHHEKSAMEQSKELSKIYKKK